MPSASRSHPLQNLNRVTGKRDVVVASDVALLRKYHGPKRRSKNQLLQPGAVWMKDPIESAVGFADEIFVYGQRCWGGTLNPAH